MFAKLFRTVSLPFVAILLLILAVPTLAAPGDLDPAFGTNGKVTTDFDGGPDVGREVAIQSDGKIVIAGYTGENPGRDFALTRYNINGSLDTTFGIGGKVTTDFSSGDVGEAVAIQSDGKIVMVGDCGAFALARYHSNGSLDTSFDGDGKVKTAFDLYSPADPYDVAIQTDGKIVVAGTFMKYQSVGPFFFHNDIIVARYNTNGGLDTSFGNAGWVTTDVYDIFDYGTAVAIQSDGKIVVAGVAGAFGDQNFGLVRYNADGSLDTPFGVDGKVITDFNNGSDWGYDIAIQSDGKIVVAGFSNHSGNDDFALARYNSDGNLDVTFGTGGKVTTDFGGQTNRGWAVAIQSDGKIVVAGESDDDFALAVYNTNGSLDTSFGIDGKVTTDFGGDDVGNDVAIQSNGQIIIAGCGDDNFALARYGEGDVINGDFDGNNCIELYDFVEFAGAFGSCTGDTNYNLKGDFDDNGCVELYDFVEFAGVFGTCY